MRYQKGLLDLRPLKPHQQQLTDHLLEALLAGDHRIPHHNVSLHSPWKMIEHEN